MINNYFLGRITNITGSSRILTNEHGEKVAKEYVTFKIESADIPIDEMVKLFPSIQAIYEAFTPVSFTEIKFPGLIPMFTFSFYREFESKTDLFNNDNVAKFGMLLIDEMILKMYEQIPTFIFKLSFPVGFGSERELLSNLRNKIVFCLTNYNS